MPVITAGDLAQTAVLTEVAGQTGVATPLDQSTPASGVIHFTDVDLTDRPTASVTTQTATYLAADGHTVLTLTSGQLAAIKGAFAIAAEAGNTDNGAIDWSYKIADSALDFLAKNETVQLVSTVTVDDHNGGTAATTVTLNITGTNDVPIVANTGLTGAVTEQVNSGGVVTVGGNALIDRPHVDSATGVIFVDLNNPIQQSGPINEWSIYAGQAGGQVELLIYRPSGNNWTFVGSSPLQSVSSVGINNFTLPSSINVQANDLVAFWYPPGTIPSIEANWDQGQTINNANWPLYPIDAGQLASTFEGTIPSLIGGPTFGNTVWGTNTRTYSIAVESSSGVNLNSSGTIAFTDVDLTDIHHINPTITASNGALGTLTAQVTTDTTGTGTGGVITWNYSVANSAVAYLAQNETKVENFTVTLNDGHGGTVDRTIAVTITGTNEAPVINTIAETDLNEQTNTSPLTTTIPVTFTDVDLTNIGHTAAITDVVTSGVTSGLALNTAALEALITPATVVKASGSSSGSVNLGFSAASTAFDYLAAGEKLTLTYTVAIDDHAGGVTPKTFAVVITGTNDVPVIAQGSQSADVTAEGNVYATGQLTASDLDLTDTQSWSIIGGNGIAPPSYHYGIAEFKVTSGAAVIIDDNFATTVPPASPTTTPYYVFGGSLTSSTDADGRTIASLDSANAGFAGGLTPAGPFFGQFVTLLTDRDPANLSSGLKLGTQFSVSGLFDLTAAPVSGKYGIRLDDRLFSPSQQPQPGNDVVELAASHNSDGSTTVVFEKFDFTLGTATLYGSATINNPGGVDDGIFLKLDTSITGVVTASFELANNGVLDTSPSAGFTFNTTSQIFSGENWTLAQFFGAAPGQPSASPQADSFLQGTYGVLDVNQNGAWKYLLSDGQNNVKALAAGQTVVDPFTIQVADGHGGVATQTVNITVTGTNDAPVVSAATLMAVDEDTLSPAGATIAALFTNKFYDADTGATLKGIAIVGYTADTAKGVWEYNDNVTTVGSPEWQDISAAGISATNALVLSATSSLRFVPAPNFNGPAPSLTVYGIDDTYTGPFSGASIQQLVTLSAPGSVGGQTPFSATRTTISTLISAVNDAPVASGSATLGPIFEDATSLTSATVSSLFGGHFSDATDDLVSSGGSSPNTFAGIAISSYTADPTKGDWQYSIGNAGSWVTLDTVASGMAVTLASGDALRFVPASNYSGAATTLSANLIESGETFTSGTTITLPAVGGTTQYSAATVALNETIIPVNVAPMANDDPAIQASAYYFALGDGNTPALWMLTGDGTSSKVADLSQDVAQSLGLFAQNPQTVAFANAFYFASASSGAVERIDTSGNVTQLTGPSGETIFGSSYSTQFVTLDGNLFFHATDGLAPAMGGHVGLVRVDQAGAATWISNDFDNVTGQLSFGGAGMQPFVVNGHSYLFGPAQFNNPPIGPTFWQLDPDGTITKIADLPLGFSLPMATPADTPPVVLGNSIYVNNSASSYSIDTVTGVAKHLGAGSINNWSTFDGSVYFWGDNGGGPSSMGLYRFDANGTATLIDNSSLSQGISYPTVVGGSLYYFAGDGLGGNNFVRIDAGGTLTLVADLANLSLPTPVAGGIHLFDNSFYFDSSNPNGPSGPLSRHQVFKLDTDGHLTQLSSFTDDPGQITNWFELGGKVYFHVSGGGSVSAGEFVVNGDTAVRVSTDINNPPANVDVQFIDTTVSQEAALNIVEENHTLSVSAQLGVLANDTDTDTPHQNLTALLVDGPQHASSFTLNPDGSYTYTPEANFIGSDSFTYRAFDGTNSSNVATASIIVSATNEAPMVNAGGYAATFIIQPSNVIAVDPLFVVSDADSATLLSAKIAITANFTIGDQLTFATHGNIAGYYDANSGIMTLSGLATVADYQDAIRSVNYLYDNANGTNLADRTISFTVNDGHNDSNIANIMVAVETLTPTAGDDHLAFYTGYIAESSTLFSNDRAVNHDAFTVSNVMHGSTAAAFNPATGEYTVENAYGTLHVYSQTQTGLSSGYDPDPITDTPKDVTAGDYTFVIGHHADGNAFSPADKMPIDNLDNLRADAEITDAFTYTITDNANQLSSAPATINLTIDRGPVVFNADNVSPTDLGSGTTQVTGVTLADHNPNGIVTVTATAEFGTVTDQNPNDDFTVHGTHYGVSGTVSDFNAIFSSPNGLIYTPNGDAPPDDVDHLTLTATDQYNYSDTLTFVFHQQGTGSATLTGTSGNDVIFASGNGDTLTGAGGQDNFVFTPTTGAATVTDFASGPDKIVLNNFTNVPNSGDSSFTNWLTSHVSQTATDTVIHLDVSGGFGTPADQDTITLHQFIASLTANDFIIHPGVTLGS